nr:hypothetical protein [Succinivibrionaceae bacterium]
DSWAISLGGIVSMTLGRTSRVEINGHEYALPPELIGRRIQAEQREGIIVFLDHGRPVCTYRRQDGVPGLSTKPGYTPAGHLFIEVLKATPSSMLLEWAQAIGPNTLRRATSLLHGRRDIDSLRRCVKFLGLPGGNPDLYPVFESFLATVGCTLGVSRLAEKWRMLPGKPDTTRQDPTYTFQRLHSMVEARLLGGDSPLNWRAGTGSGLGGGQPRKGIVFLNSVPPQPCGGGDPAVASAGDPPVASAGDPPVASAGDPPAANAGDPPEASAGDPPAANAGDPRQPHLN